MMKQTSLLPLTEIDKAKRFAAELLVEKCSKTKSVIITDEGRVMMVSPTRLKVIEEVTPDWIHPVRTVEQASRVLELSRRMRSA